MLRKMMTRAAIVGMLLGAFALGYMSGSVSQQHAAAQGLGGGVGGMLEQAGKGGGALGAAGQLGSSIVEMQQHVSGLQKNLDTLKQVQSMLTGK